MRKRMTISTALACLGLRDDVTSTAAESRFKQLVVKLHPDRVPDPTPVQQQRLLDVLEAIDVLRCAFDAGELPVVAAAPMPVRHPLRYTYEDDEPVDELVVRPTMDARCFRIFERGREILTLLRHPENRRVLYARDSAGRAPVMFRGVQFWTEGADGVLRPIVRSEERRAA